MKKIQSTCNYCTVGCGLEFHVENDEIKQIVPKTGYPVNPNLLCIKGLNLDKQHTVYKPTPLPKIRQANGEMKDVPWEEAYTYVADKIQDIQSKYGREAFAGLSTGQLLTEDFALFGHMMRDHLQTNLDGNTRLCMATAVVAHKESFGFDAPGYTIKDIELSDTIIFIGSNPVVAHPVIWSRVRETRKETDNVIVIDPRKSYVAKQADYHYGIKHDGDLYLLYTVANLLIQRDALDHDFIKKHTNHFEEFKEFVKDFTLDKAENPTGLKPEEIIELTDLIENGKRVSFWWCMGVNQHYEGVRVAQAIINLALMTGNIGRPGTGANSLTGQSNAMGSRLFSNTTALPGGAKFDDPDARERIASIYGVEPDSLAQKPTIPYNAIIEGINSGEIKGLWVLCTNPSHSFANNETFKEAAEKLELLVVQDIYDDTETAQVASVMFPVVPAIKKEGTMINTERRIGPVQPVLQTKGEEKTDYQVILGVAKALGMNVDRWQTPRDAFELMKEVSRGMPCDITGVDWNALKDSEGVQWPYPEGTVLTENERRLYEDGRFFTPDERANFVFETPQDNPMATSEAFPIVFNTGRISAAAWHTRTRTREIPASRELEPEDAYIIMGPRLAEELDVVAGEKVQVNSSNGQSALFDVRISEDQRNDEIFAPLHYEECNKLTLSVYDPYSKQPAYKSAPVNVEKITSTIATD